MYGKEAWVGPYIVWGRVSGVVQSGSKSVSKFDGVSDMALVYQLCGRRVQKRVNGLCSPWCQTLQFLPVCHGAFQSATAVLELRSSESEKVSPCVGSLRGTAGAPTVSSTDSIPTGFEAGSCGALSSWSRNPGLGGLVWERTPHFWDIPSEFLSTTHGWETSQFCICTPPTSLDGCGFLMWFL